MSVLPRPLPADRIERLARALRIRRCGLIRPLWEELTVDQREKWTSYAARFENTMRRHGIDLVTITPSEGQTS